MKKTRATLAAFALLVVALFATGAARADTLTLDGANIDSFALNTNVNTLSVVMATSDALQYVTDGMQGTTIDLLTLDEFAIVDGTLTLENEIEFAKDVVTSFQFVSGSDMLMTDVKFSYTEVRIIQEGGSGGDGGDGGGDGTSMPEPSSVALLASGLLGLLGFGHKKHAIARGSGLTGC